VTPLSPTGPVVDALTAFALVNLVVGLAWLVHRLWGRIREPAAAAPWDEGGD
jgi:hypothetical protein